MAGDREQLGQDDRFFRELTQCLCGTLELREGTEQAIGILRAHMPADGLHIMEIDHVAGCVRLVAGLATQREMSVSDGSVLQIPRQLLGELSQTDRAIGSIINRPSENPFIAEMHERYGIPAASSQVQIEIHKDERTVGIVVVSAAGTDRYTETHLRQLERLRVPFSIALHNALQFERVQQFRAQLEVDNSQLRGELRLGAGEVIGERMGLRGVMAMLSRVAPTDSPVVLLGETGAGKEVIANALHERSARVLGPMLRVNCGAIPESLIESELFGHERGAFTGASTTKIGLFERASGGTLFLDEVGELSLAAQVKLLRVLQTGRFERVGGSRSLRADVRLLTASHRDLAKMARQGEFREDLWYRLNVFPISIPPLRERRDDIPTLTHHFMQLHAREMGLPFQPTLSTQALDQLMSYAWPGNVRELRNVVERALILCQGKPLSFPALGRPERAAQRAAVVVNSRPLMTLEEASVEHIKRVIAATGGRLKGPGGAAEILGLPPSTLRNKMKRLGL